MGIYSTYVFPRIMNRVISGDNFDDVRRATLAGVGGNTLEIGFGTGLNLPHYPASVKKLTTIDVNPGMSARAMERANQFGIDVDHRVLDGQSLTTGDATFDSIVTTWTLCSIPDVRKALKEIYRTLAPDGRFFFVEHGLSNEPQIQKWQHRLTPVQRIFGDGCHLDRNMELLIRSAGFHIVELDMFYMEKVPRVGGFLYRGVAARGQRERQT